jgi:hypothetical protein
VSTDIEEVTFGNVQVHQQQESEISFQIGNLLARIKNNG